NFSLSSYVFRLSIRFFLSISFKTTIILIILMKEDENWGFRKNNGGGIRSKFVEKERPPEIFRQSAISERNAVQAKGRRLASYRQAFYEEI
ncbi:hypothetical protein ABEV74_21815, partial [Paenibacillus cisolokensis]|uniref:hypothetical protein n=1 Tax=Paenibacillus cisolokensis TaxID=1658519 RepID=UPI003D2CB8D1